MSRLTLMNISVIIVVSFNYSYKNVESKGWIHVATLKNPERGVRYPTLIKLVKALLCVFTGPRWRGHSV